MKANNTRLEAEGYAVPSFSKFYIWDDIWRIEADQLCSDIAVQFQPRPAVRELVDKS